jgi:hypothetical protein
MLNRNWGGSSRRGLLVARAHDAGLPGSRERQAPACAAEHAEIVGKLRDSQCLEGSS